MKHGPWILVDDDTVADRFVGWRCGTCNARVDFHADPKEGTPSSSREAPPDDVDNYVDPCARPEVTVKLSVLEEAIESSSDEEWKARMRVALAAAASEKA